MVLQLLPASAKAFAERTGPNVVLGVKPELWLTQTLKRINKQKRPLNNVSQHQRCLEDILSGKEAIWLLASTVMAKTPAKEFTRYEDPILECYQNHSMLHIEGYVVHVDMIHRHEVAFKLTQDTIDNLIDYHKHVWSIDSADGYAYDWPEKARSVQKLHDEYVQAVNGYVFRTDAKALEGLEEEGTGELIDHLMCMAVKKGIDSLLKPLLPPPPKIVDLIGPPMGWWQSQFVVGGYYASQYAQPYAAQYAPQYQQSQLLQPPADPWRVLGSTPSPSPSYQPEVPQPATWSQAPQPVYAPSGLPSPTPSYTQPQTYSSASPFPSYQAMASPLLPLPSSLISQQHCSTSASSSYGNYFGGYDMPLTPIGAF